MLARLNRTQPCIPQSCCFERIGALCASQANGEGGTQRLYTGLLDCIGKTYRSEGVRGFYLGCTANVVRMIPTGAIQHSAYSFLKDAFNCS